jgi:hypothetical protein
MVFFELRAAGLIASAMAYIFSPFLWAISRLST